MGNISVKIMLEMLSLYGSSTAVGIKVVVERGAVRQRRLKGARDSASYQLRVQERRIHTLTGRVQFYT